MSGFIDGIAHAAPPFFVFAVVITGFGFYLGFVSLRRYRLIEDVPTAKVRSAPQGYVELIGQAGTMEGEPIVAPLSQTPCCWYSYRIEERGDKSWHTIESGTSDGLFLLRDDTGECVVDPEDAKVDTVHEQYWHGDAHSIGVGTHLRAADRQAHRRGGLLSALNLRISVGIGEYRYHEKVILDGDPLYAIGWFKSLDDIDHAQSEKELTGEILRQWKKQPQTLIERFDHDRNGEVDLQEWEEARLAAARLARQQLAEHAAENTHVHTLSKPKGRQFLISNRDEDAMISRYKWQAIMGFAMFFLGAWASLLMITTQFFGA